MKRSTKENNKAVKYNYMFKQNASDDSTVSNLNLSIDVRLNWTNYNLKKKNTLNTCIFLRRGHVRW